MDPIFYERLMRTGFGHRSTVREDGQVVYALADRSGHVLLPGKDWRELGKECDLRLRAIRKRTLWVVFGLPPILLFVPGSIGALLGALLPFGGQIAAALLLAGLAFWVCSYMVWYPLSVRAVTQDIEGRMSAFPKTKPIARDPRRKPRWFEILFLILIGPHLLICLAGEIGGPDTFRNTPWVGRSLGGWEIAAFVVLIAWFAWPHIIARFSSR